MENDNVQNPKEETPDMSNAHFDGDRPACERPQEEPLCDTVGMKETDPIEGKEDEEPTEAEVEIKELYVCPDCDSTEEDVDKDTLYECGDCGNVFAKQNSESGNHRCECGKYASLFTRHGCPDCNVEMEKQTVYDYEGTIYKDVEELREAIEENGEVISEELEEELKDDSVTPEPKVEADDAEKAVLDEMQEAEKSDAEEKE